MSSQQQRHSLVLLTGRQTELAWDKIKAFSNGTVDILAASPPYNTRVAGPWWKVLVEHGEMRCANAAMFGMPMTNAVDKFFQEDAVIQACQDTGVRLEFDWSAFVARKYTKLQRVIDAATEDDDEFKKNASTMKTLFQDVSARLDCPDDYPEDELLGEMRAVQAPDQWKALLFKYLPFLPQGFENHLHVTGDDDMILSLFGASPALIGRVAADRELMRACEWVSKLFSVSWGVKGCIGDFFNTIYLLQQRAIQLYPDRFSDEEKQVFNNPPRPSKTSSHELAIAMFLFGQRVSAGTLVPFWRGDTQLMHLHDLELDDEKARLVYELFFVQCGRIPVQEVAQIPKIDEENGWTEAKAQVLIDRVVSRSGTIIRDPECENGKVLAELV